jgi:hypothetical protein
MKKLRIAVVGGGIGGLTAALTLQDKGHTVVVFEKESRPGGKCWSPTFEGQAFEMGACSVSPEFHTVLKLARRYKQRLRRRFPFWVMGPDGSRTTFRQEYWKVADTPAILLEMGRYLYHAANFGLRYNRPSGYLNLPKVYEASFRQFCRDHKMERIAPWMELPVTSFGYGDLDTIKTWYVLDYVNVVNFMGLAIQLILMGQSPVHQFLEGYGALVTAMARDLDVRLGSAVRNIDRGRAGVTITTDAIGVEPERFDAVVLAVPLQELKDCLEFNAEEKLLVGDLKSNTYAIAACVLNRMPQGNHLLRFNACQQNFGHVALIERGMHGDASKLCMCYIPVIDRDFRLDKVLDWLGKDLAKLGLDLERVVESREWTYFSHFLHRWSYAILEDLQGKNGTYYVGGMAKFELAERVARDAEALAEDLFEGKRPREWFTTLRNWAYFYLKSEGAYASPPSPQAVPAPAVAPAAVRAARTQKSR